MTKEGTLTAGHASCDLSVFLRLGELICGAIVLGLLGRAFYLIRQAGVTDPNGRLIYVAVTAALAILYSLFFTPPLGYSFWFFPIDFFFFAAWLVAFCLLETGQWYVVGAPGINVNWSGCSAYRTVLAFSFVACFTYLLSFPLVSLLPSDQGRGRTDSDRASIG
ncbi:hypothetical protein B0T14DRAFT_538201 [Immersiella caudata]|uniref:MARVEL domain-containing protein n=1 Tax=Immersiella caudata TaxID=314043 RepID=A0AA39WSY5_9PEZI|nr:hypothetical protein B0T14DRAFT_538201 [Immersiella caudata]